MKMKEFDASKIIAYLVILLFVVICLYPFIWTVSTSLKAENEPFANEGLIPQGLAWQNYIKVWTEANLMRNFINSVVVLISSVAGHLLLAGLAGYAFARLKFPGKNLLFFYFLVSLMVPGFVSLIPRYILIKRLGMFNTLWGVFFPYIGMGIAISIYLIRTFLENIPLEIEEAARIDGAGDFRIFWQIMLPLTRPALVMVAILMSLILWSEFMWAFLVLQDNKLKTLPVILRDFVWRYPANWELLSSALVISVVPILAAFAILQKQFIRGFVEGAVKG